MDLALQFAFPNLKPADPDGDGPLEAPKFYDSRTLPLYGPSGCRSAPGRSCLARLSPLPNSLPHRGALLPPRLSRPGRGGRHGPARPRGRQLPARRDPGPRRDGHGLQRRARLHQEAGRGEGPAPAVRPLPGGGQPVPARGPGRVVDQPPQHRRRHRLRGPRRRPGLLRHGVPRRGLARGRDRARRRGRAAPRAQHRQPDGAGARGRPRQGRRPPRPQARQHHAAPAAGPARPGPDEPGPRVGDRAREHLRLREGPRLRHRQGPPARRPRRRDHPGRGLRHARVHVARGGPRRGRRRARRRLLARRHPVRHADRAAAVRGPGRQRRAPDAHPQGAAVAARVRAPPRDHRGRRAGRPARDAEGPGPPLPEHGRAPGRPRARLRHGVVPPPRRRHRHGAARQGGPVQAADRGDRRLVPHRRLGHVDRAGPDAGPGRAGRQGSSPSPR